MNSRQLTSNSRKETITMDCSALVLDRDALRLQRKHPQGRSARWGHGILVFVAVLTLALFKCPAAVAGWYAETFNAQTKSAAITYNGQLHVFTPGRGCIIEHNWLTGSSWNFETLDCDPYLFFLGMNIAPVICNNQLHLFYGAQKASESQRLRHGWWDGVRWNFETLEYPFIVGGLVGGYNTAVSYGGQLHYFTNIRFTSLPGYNWIRHGWWDGRQWNFELLPAPSGNPRDLVALADNGQLHVFGMGGSGLGHSWWDGRRWSFETLDAGVSTGENATAVIYNRQIHLFNVGDGNRLNLYHPVLRHGLWDGSRWSFETLDASVSEGYGASAIFYSGQLHVFNQGDIDGHSMEPWHPKILRHGWWNGFRWSFETLDANASSGFSVAVVTYGFQLHVFNAGYPSKQRHVWYIP